MKPTKPFLRSILFLVLVWGFAGRVGWSQGLIEIQAGGGPAGFCGDGERSPTSCLQRPRGMTADTDGNLYIADTGNHRVRRITPGGIISTFAGTGTSGFSGDGGPALQASFRSPTSAAFDPLTGDRYIMDSGNNRVRKVAANGIITTIAGDGATTFRGDGGPATAASINPGGGPAGLLWTGVALFLTDIQNQRIRRIDLNGIITTVAGTGQRGFGGDGGPSTQASLKDPAGTLAADALGNLYFSDTGNHRVRRINLLGIINTVAGSSTGGFGGDGGQATSAFLRLPVGVALDTAGALYIADSGNDRIRRVAPDGIISTVAGGGMSNPDDADFSTDVSLQSPEAVFAGPRNVFVADTDNNRVLTALGVFASPGPVTVLPARRDFEAKLGGEVPAPQGLVLFSPDLSEFAFTAESSTVSGGDWLVVRPRIGFAPSALPVFVNPGSLLAGVYQGSITLTVAQATNSPVTVPVTLTVTDEPPALAVAPDHLAFSAMEGGNPSPQALDISNAGGGTLNWTADVLLPAAAVSLGPFPQINLSATAGTDTTPVRVSVDSTGVGPGSYQAAILVRTTSEPLASRFIPVLVQVTLATAVLRTSQSGLIFEAVEGSGALPSRDFKVVNAGSGDMSWMVEIRSISGGNWLTVSPTDGISTAGQAPLSVFFNADATGLAAGSYHAVVRIRAPGAANSPQFVHAVLNLLPPGSTPPPQPSPSGLLFLANAGGTPPAAQQVLVFTGGGGTVNFSASTTAIDDEDWLRVNPSNGTASATTPGQLSVRVDPSALAVGVYRGLVNVALSDGSTRSVNVLLVAPPPGTFTTSGTTSGTTPGSNLMAEIEPPRSAQEACTPSKLAMVHTALVTNFASPVGFPIPLVAQVTDDCGTVQTDAAVVSTFSSGDPALVMANLKNGQYSGTWIPTSAASIVTITTTAVASGFEQATAQISGAIAANAVPQVYSGGAVHAATFGAGAPLAPGSVFSIFGTNLAADQFFAQEVPLPKELGGLSATLGDFDVPLFFTSSGQVNAQVPFELPPDSSAQLVVKVGEAFTVPETINLSAVQPGIFTVNSSGSGPGSITDVNFALVSSSNPVRAGDAILIFCTGLGATSPPFSSGERAPLSPLFTVVTPVTATVDGLSAPVLFNGLAPNLVGVYQVNVQIPVGVSSGEVDLVLTQGGVNSNTVTIFVTQ